MGLHPGYHHTDINDPIRLAHILGQTIQTQVGGGLIVKEPAEQALHHLVEILAETVPPDTAAASAWPGGWWPQERRTQRSRTRGGGGGPVHSGRGGRRGAEVVELTFVYNPPLNWSRGGDGRSIAAFLFRPSVSQRVQVLKGPHEAMQQKQLRGMSRTDKGSEQSSNGCGNQLQSAGNP